MHRTVPVALVSLLSLTLLIATGCERTGLEAGTDSGTADSGGRDAGQGPTSFSYTPAGCGYQVATPEVAEAAMGTDAFGSAPTPVHVHTSWAGPADTTFAVDWQSDVDTRATHVLYGTDQATVMGADGPGSGVMDQLGHEMLLPAGIGTDPTRLHEVHVCGLTAGTQYFYKVGGPGHFSQVFAIATAPPKGSTDPFSFAVTGDARNQQENAWAISQHHLLDRGMDFEIFSGDAVVLGVIQSDWNAFFEATDGAFSVEDLFGSMPMMPVNGNHDNLSVNYVAQFALPQQVTPGEQAQGEEWYSFDYANAHFVMLNDTVADTSVLGGAEADFLRSDLGSVDRSVTPWIFVVHHRPFYTCLSTHAPDTSLRAAWQPIFDSNAVDMVLTGHNHVYERSKPVRGLMDGQGVVAAAGAGGIPTFDASGTPSGTVYVVAAGVGAPLYGVSSDCNFTEDAMSERNYVVIQIADKTLTFTAYDALTDVVLDTFTYTK